MILVDAEQRKMAIINLTCDYPFEFFTAPLAKWSGLSFRTVDKLVRLLDLDVKRTPRRSGTQMVKIPLKDYLKERPIPEKKEIRFVKLNKKEVKEFA